MLHGVIVNFELNLPLPANARDVTICPSTYWGIIVAKPKGREPLFAGRNQGEILDLVVRSAGEATKEAVADNDTRGINSPGSRDGKLVVRRPGGQIVTLDS